MKNFPAMQVGQATVASLATSAETDLLVITEANALLKNEFSFYYSVAMGAATEVNLRYYAAFVKKAASSYVSTDWFLLPGKTVGTASAVTDGYLKVNSTLSFVDTLCVGASNNASGNVLPGCVALKVTGRGVTSATSTITITAMVRD